MDWQEILRDIWLTSFVFFSLLAFTRLLGKTQVGQLTFYEYINGITLGSIAASVVAAEPDKIWSHFFDLVIFVILTFIISLITIKSRPLRKIIEGPPTTIIENGQILKENMGKLRYDLDELNSQLRIKGVLDLAEVQFAFLEPSGELSVIKKSAYQNVTKSDLKLTAANPSLPLEIIMDGEVLEENLTQKGLSSQWLTQELQKQGLLSPKDVTYAVLDSNGKLFISKKVDPSSLNH